VGVDTDSSMLATARSRAPDLEWIEHDLTTLDLGRVFDVVVMAGNVPLFTPPGTESALVAGCARHVAPAGVLVAGFQLDRSFSVDAYDAHCDAAGLVLHARYSTWDGNPWAHDDSYVVSVHRRR
jgi:trans-aconitate methyltransferase